MVKCNCQDWKEYYLECCKMTLAWTTQTQQSPPMKDRPWLYCPWCGHILAGK